MKFDRKNSIRICTEQLPLTWDVDVVEDIVPGDVTSVADVKELHHILRAQLLIPSEDELVLRQLEGRVVISELLQVDIVSDV